VIGKISYVRNSESIHDSIRSHVLNVAPGSECYLFGSRVNDRAKGGDIDLLLLTQKKLPLTVMRRIRRLILNQIGEQKLDIVNFTRSSLHPHKAAALEPAVRL
jgi:predicted nucleotidyltransferase